jgi:hypothetical protein
VPEEKFDSAIPWLPPITEDTIAVSAHTPSRTPCTFSISHTVHATCMHMSSVDKVVSSITCATVRHMCQAPTPVALLLHGADWPGHDVSQDYWRFYLVTVALIILFGGLLAPILEVKLGVGGA